MTWGRQQRHFPPYPGSKFAKHGSGLSPLSLRVVILPDPQNSNVLAMYPACAINSLPTKHATFHRAESSSLDYSVHWQSPTMLPHRQLGYARARAPQPVGDLYDVTEIAPNVMAGSCSSTRCSSRGPPKALATRLQSVTSPVEPQGSAALSETKA